jgi:hypothetical protein
MLLHTARRVDVSIILVSGKIMAKSGCKCSLLQGRESDIFWEEKIQKERNLLRGCSPQGVPEAVSA